MKLVYTGIESSLTQVLVKEVVNYVEKGKKVFYIAPNSLSFEKEKAVLEQLEGHASFNIIVTRFMQLGRYLLTRSQQTPSLMSDQGLVMVFYKVLSQLSESELKVFGQLKNDYDFIQQLVDLYQEIKASKIDIEEMIGLDIPEKKEDFKLIFSKVDEHIEELGYPLQTPLAYLTMMISQGVLDNVLKDTVFVIDGFSRFSVEERSLVSELENRSSDVIVGLYLSKRALRSSYTNGNLYQASLDFIAFLKTHFKVEEKNSIQEVNKASLYSKISNRLESVYDFTEIDVNFNGKEKGKLSIRELPSIRNEIEEVAVAIRKDLRLGYRYKDILVLLGDVDTYYLQLGSVFEKFEIPFYYGKSESMAHHPLIHFIENLERIGRYQFRYEDVINLFKTGLYADIDNRDLDSFERYVKFTEINGSKSFSEKFEKGSKNSYHFKDLNHFRETNLKPLIELFKARKQKGKNLLNKLLAFFNEISLANNMGKLVEFSSLIEKEKNEEVWKAFTEIIEQYHLIFKDEKMTIYELLSLMKQAILSVEYRVVPATVDVVGIKSYDLIEPHTAKIVYAIGMSRQYFPKISVNHSLISDEERLVINEELLKHEGNKSLSYLDVLKTENIKKNHFTALSLLNSAKDKLVISYPKMANGEVNVSPYVLELMKMGFVSDTSLADKRHLGHYKALISQILSFYHYDTDDQWDKETETFWKVMSRYLSKKLDQEGLRIPKISQNIATKIVDETVIKRRFKDGLHLSTTALTDFYSNQYLYFVKYVLGLREQERLRLDASVHGRYLHRVFELLLQSKPKEDSTSLISDILSQVNKEESIKLRYGNNQETYFSQMVLEDIARFTAQIILENHSVHTDKEELPFKVAFGEDLTVRGVIDRLDRLSNQSVGVVDYKSSQSKFDLEKFYNGLNSQLITYLNYLSTTKETIFGAMYFHMKEPKLDLVKEKSLEDLPVSIRKQLTYRGLFLKDEADSLPNNQYSVKDSTYTQEELDILLAYNNWLYQDAAKQILSGKFLINPYSSDQKSVSGDQLKAITGFEADNHFSQARQLRKFPRKDKKVLILSEMKNGVILDDKEEDKDV